jgi:DNA topoisomerase IB
MSRESTPPARPAPAAEQAARAAGLHYVSDQLPGIRRQRCGRGFVYQSAGGRRLRRAAELTRIARLGIPPAYQDVWICPDARGHLQATGRDARGRKQYRYHPRWQQVRGNEKFAHMIAFGAALPLLRRQIRQDMAREGLPRRKVLATVAWLLDETRARIGNAAYARDNHSFGITTLQNRHVSFVRGGGAVLSFRGKGGVPHEILVDHKRLVQIVRQCRELPGQHLFQYRDRRGVCRRIDSGDVNRYLRRFLQGDFTAKDFRTWNATLRCVALLAGTAVPDPPGERSARRAIARVVRRVARELRNTPAVCRRSYLDPDLFAAWRSGAVHQTFGTSFVPDSARGEAKILRFLKRRARAAGAKPAARSLRRTQSGAALSARRRYPKPPRYETVRASAAAPPM